MAKGKDLRTAQRGIALSVTSALVVSTLILIVGAGFHQDGGPATSFTISQLSVFIKQFVGQTGVIIFAVGFIAAALSSMLTIPLGAAITADTVFSQDSQELRENKKITDSNYQLDDNQASKVKLEVKGEDLKEKDDFTEANHKIVENPTTKVELDVEEEEEPKRLPWSIYFGIILIEVVISTAIISANGR